MALKKVLPGSYGHEGTLHCLAQGSLELSRSLLEAASSDCQDLNSGILQPHLSECLGCQACQANMQSVILVAESVLP